MTDWFVDTALGTGANDGTSTDNAWRGTSAIKKAFEYASYTSGDKVWVRRTSAYDEGVVGLNADITATYDSSIKLPTAIMGAPRAEVAITSATWTNGSTTVDDIVGPTLTRGAHCGRYITAPDGKKYFITKITDSNTLIIDRPYPSGSVSSTSGAATIWEDEDYDTFMAIDDSAWTIKIDDWAADAHELPVIDFNNEAYQIGLGGAIGIIVNNFDFQDSADTNGIIYNAQGTLMSQMTGCLVKQSSNNSRAIYCLGTKITRLIVEGSADGASQFGLMASGCSVKDAAIYNMGGVGFSAVSVNYLENVNIGVEVSNVGNDFQTNTLGVATICKDVKFTTYALNDARLANIPVVTGWVSVENYNKILGAHKYFNTSGTVEKLAVVEGSGTPYKRSGGADNVLKILCNVASGTYRPVLLDWQESFFIHEFETDGTSKTYRYYVQSDVALTDDTQNSAIWLEAEYVDAYDDSDEYHMTTVRSTNHIAAKSGSDDWTQYLEVTVDPAVASKVRIKLFVNYYHATNCIYVDPKVVIS